MNFKIHTDVSRLCRICLKEAKTMEYIYKSSDPDRPSLHRMLSAVCAPVFDSEDVHEQIARESFGMPKSVCRICKLKVLAAYELYEACIEGDRKLWEMVIIQKELIGDEGATDEQPNTTEAQNEISKGVSTRELPETANDDSSEKDPASANTEEFYRNKTIFTCDVCSVNFISKKRLRIHILEFHPESVKQCQECDDIFVSEVQMEDHKLYHRTGKRFSCDVCKKRFSTTTGHRLHARSHVKFTPFQCDKCDKSFSTMGILKSHVMRHNGQRDIACEICPLRFYTKGSLKLHMITHTNEQKFACDICDSRFKNRDSLIKHTQKHSGERPHQCTECTMKFFTTSQLKCHIRTHTGERPYKCAYCDRAFKQSTDLLRHSRNHVGDKPYQCDICTDSFRLVTELRNHYAVHFKPGAKGAAEMIDKLKTKYTSNGVKEYFSITTLLNRRFEQEKVEEDMDTEEGGSSEQVDTGNTNEYDSADAEEKNEVENE